MNNSVFQVKDLEPEELKDKELQKSVKICESIRGIREDRNYQELIALVFEQEIQTIEKRIQRNVKSLKEDITNVIKQEIIYDTGLLKGLQKLVHLDDLEKQHKVVIEKIKKNA